ncbi:MAG: hypothetical protein ABI144_00725 [Gallionella sp.]
MIDPGRICPLRYRYGAAAIATAPVRQVETLYVVGGLYGNLPALDVVESMAAAEQHPVTLCFNGDFNWFNVDNEGFRAVNQRVLQHHATLGNVEAELQVDADDAGCGCAYPDDVAADVVERSNQIHARLRAMAQHHPDILEQLAGLPMFARYRVGSANIGVVHGDAESLSGWRFDMSMPEQIKETAWLCDLFDEADVDVFASTHTCLPVLRHSGDMPGGRVVINNGAAGMPNFSATRYGLLTRVSIHPACQPTLYGVTLQGVHIDALSICYDSDAWQTQFLANWPKHSAAWTSYYSRILHGPQYSMLEASKLTNPA